MMIQTSLNNIKTQFTDENNITLSGDLGYLTSKKYKINNNDVFEIIPKRKNQQTIKMKLKMKL